MLERDRDEMKDALTSISQSLQRLVALEERHMETREGLNRAFSAIEKQNNRIAEIEKHMPGLQEVRVWVINGVLTVVGIVGMAAMAMVVK